MWTAAAFQGGGTAAKIRWTGLLGVFAEMDAKIAGWQTPASRKHAFYKYHDFICERL